MIFKALKDKKVNQFGWIHGDRIFNLDIPLLLPREAQFKDFEMEGIEGLHDLWSSLEMNTNGITTMK